VIAETEPFMLVFRFLHIVAGAAWLGSAFLFVGIIGPSAAEVGPAALPLMTVAVRKRKVHKVITYLGMTAVTAGWVMWFKHLSSYDWSLSEWVGTTFGLVLTIGGLIATATFFVGYLGVGRNVERLVDLGNQIHDAGGPPTPEQGAEMEKIQAGLEKFGKIDLLLLLLAITAMSTARYW
jgi:uncharacterized membrane protein